MGMCALFSNLAHNMIFGWKQHISICTNEVFYLINLQTKIYEIAHE